MVLSKVLDEEHFKTNWFGVFKLIMCLINMWFLHPNSLHNTLYFFTFVDILPNFYQVLIVFVIPLILFVYSDLIMKTQMMRNFNFVAFELRIV